MSSPIKMSSRRSSSGPKSASKLPRAADNTPATPTFGSPSMRASKRRRIDTDTGIMLGIRNGASRYLSDRTASGQNENIQGSPPTNASPRMNTRSSTRRLSEKNQPSLSLELSGYPRDSDPIALALWVARKTTDAGDEQASTNGNAVSPSHQVHIQRSVDRNSSVAGSPYPSHESTPRTRRSLRKSTLSQEIHFDSPTSERTMATMDPLSGESNGADYSHTYKKLLARLAPQLSGLELFTPGFADKYFRTQARDNSIDGNVVAAGTLLINILATLSTGKLDSKLQAAADALIKGLDEEPLRFTMALSLLSRDPLVVQAVNIINSEARSNELTAAAGFAAPIDENGEYQKSLSPDIHYLKEPSASLNTHDSRPYKYIPSPSFFSSSSPPSLPQPSLDFSQNHTAALPKSSFDSSLSPSTSLPQPRTFTSPSSHLSNSSPNHPHTDTSSIISDDFEIYEVIAASSKMEGPRRTSTRKRQPSERAIEAAQNAAASRPQKKAKKANNKKKAAAAATITTPTTTPPAAGQLETAEESAVPLDNIDLAVVIAVAGSNGIELSEADAKMVQQILHLASAAVADDWQPEVEVDVAAARRRFYGEEEEEEGKEEAAAPVGHRRGGTLPTIPEEPSENEDEPAGAQAEPVQEVAELVSAPAGGTQSGRPAGDFADQPRPFTSEQGWLYTGRYDSNGAEIIEAPKGVTWHEAKSTPGVPSPPPALKPRDQVERDEIFGFPPVTGSPNVPQGDKPFEPEDVEAERELIAARKMAEEFGITFDQETELEDLLGALGELLGCDPSEVLAPSFRGKEKRATTTTNEADAERALIEARRRADEFGITYDGETTLEDLMGALTELLGYEPSDVYHLSRAKKRSFDNDDDDKVVETDEISASSRQGAKRRKRQRVVPAAETEPANTPRRRGRPVRRRVE
ncbi:hypothetical protein AJ80_07792 [Polytolypa hystricis UAMH7299]|uniref:Uncharacterized protein n=1 Tax=Polytolypa hystricis (strain UAMH7299) TaxID=1447883 RepID=A0A2B7XAT1_POLH7|nr:hypothetical protein AJ80_07792 [Polytolypa hystricis UAMH7299]